MIDFFTRIVFNRHSELRTVWKILLFLFLASLITAVLFFPLMRVFPSFDILSPLVLLIGMLAATYVMTRFINKKPFGAVGLSFHPAMFREFGMGMFLGFAMMMGISVVERMAGLVAVSWRPLSVGGAVWMVLSGFFTFGVAALAEEVSFRGYLFQTLIQGITFVPATLLLSGLFAAAHASNPDVSTFGLVNVGLAGIWLSVAYMKTRSLWLPFGLHWAWNFTQTTICGFSTSGYGFDKLRLLNSVQNGPVWLTGGAFGPEGGALATVALLVSTGYILKSRLLAAPEGIVTLDSLEDLLGSSNGSGDKHT